MNYWLPLMLPLAPAVCTPFPRSLFPCTSELDENDYSGVSRVLESLPYLSKLGSREDLSRRTAPEIALLHWLFHDRLLSRHKRMKEVGLEDLKNSLHVREPPALLASQLQWVAALVFAAADCWPRGAEGRWSVQRRSQRHAAVHST